MKVSQYCQTICELAVIVLGYSIITPSIWAQGNGKRPALLPKDERIASSDIGSAQPAATDRLVTAPAASRSTPIVASDSPNVRETKVKENTPSPKLESTPPNQDYVIDPQDLLAINVWHEPELSVRFPCGPTAISGLSSSLIGSARPGWGGKAMEIMLDPFLSRLSTRS
jgi:hypothetical protein